MSVALILLTCFVLGLYGLTVHAALSTLAPCQGCLLEVVLLVEILECLTARVMLCRILDSSAEAVVASAMKDEAY